MSTLTSSRMAGMVLFILVACLPVTRIGVFEGTNGALVDKAHPFPLEIHKAVYQPFNRQDIDAVRNAALEPWSNGQTAGGPCMAAPELNSSAPG